MERSKLIDMFVKVLEKSSRFYSPHKATKEKFFGIFDIMAMDLRYHSSDIALFTIANDQDDFLEKTCEVEEFVEEFIYPEVYVVLKKKNGWLLREVWHAGDEESGGIEYKNQLYDDNLREVKKK